MKIKSILVAALAALTLAACSKDSDNGATIEGEGLFLRFTGLSELTRAETTPVDDQTPVVFNDGYLVFEKADNTIERVVPITNNTSVTAAVTVSDLERGVVFKDVEAVNVYVIGNELTTAPAVGASTSTIFGNKVNILTQTDSNDNYGISNATLFGSGAIVPATHANAIAAGAQKQAMFGVKPLIARFEMSGITGKNTAGAAIVSYDLRGIYINNFYYEIGINGAVINVNDLRNFGTNHTLYTPNNASSYQASWAQKLYDGLTLSSSVDAGNQVARPTTGNVWAYNVFAPIGFDNAKSNVPHIVLHFENMKVDLGSGPEDYDNTETHNDGQCYLTITRYINGSTDEAIEAGKVYRLTDVPFDADDLDNLPEENVNPDKGFTVYVEVEFLDWTTVDVTGGW